METAVSDRRPRRGPSIDEAECARVIREGTRLELTVLRAQLVAMKVDVERQLAIDRSDELGDRAQRIREGSHMYDAVERARAGTDHEWRARAIAFQKLIEGWLVQIKGRLGHEVAKPWSAVAIKGAGSSTQKSVDAINMLIARGCRVSAFSVLGADLIVIATEPTED